MSGPDTSSEHRTSEKAVTEPIIHCTLAMAKLTGSENCYSAQGKELNPALWKAHFLLGKDTGDGRDSWSILPCLLVAKGRKKNIVRWIFQPAI